MVDGFSVVGQGQAQGAVSVFGAAVAVEGMDAGQPAVQPPSINSAEPVTSDDASEAR